MKSKIVLGMLAVLLALQAQAAFAEGGKENPVRHNAYLDLGPLTMGAAAGGLGVTNKIRNE
jgi:hypothetical protein